MLKTCPDWRNIALCDYEFERSNVFLVTLRVSRAQYAFGEVLDSRVKLSEAGRFAYKWWIDMPFLSVYCKLSFDAFVIMPNYIQGILAVPWHPQPADVWKRRAARLKTFAIELPVSMRWILKEFRDVVGPKCKSALPQRGYRFWEPGIVSSEITDKQQLAETRELIWSRPEQWVNDPRLAFGATLHNL